MRWAGVLSVVLLCLVSAVGIRADASWATERHEQGYCALYGTAGHRLDHDPLARPNNTRAQPVKGDVYKTLQTVCPQLTAENGGEDGRYCCDDSQIDELAKKIQIGTIFLVGCPACAHNFKHFFCELTCSPDQSTFANVTHVQKAHDTKENAVKQVDYFVSDYFGEQFYNSCKDVVYPVMSTKAMLFVGGGAKNFSEWFDFLGLVKDKRFPKAGSPFQMNFPGEETTPEDMLALNGSIPACWDAAQQCSCGDCPEAPQCTPVPLPQPPEQPGCRALGLRHVRCMDLGLVAMWLVALAALYWAFATPKGRRLMFGGLDAAESGMLDASMLPEWPTAKDGFASGLVEGQIGEVRPRRQPWARHHLGNFFRWQGQWCAERPGWVLLTCVLLVVACALGLLRLRVETDPQRLWVGTSSQALAEKQHFENSFGPFYRIEQLLLTTTPKSSSRFKTPGGLPSIISDSNIKLLFDVQQEVDALHAHTKDGRNVTLRDVCYKPFGAECATQSLLQYWQMNRTVYEKGDATTHGRLSPDFCLSHWSTQCRSDYGGPQDPRTALGGFPMDSSFRNYSADASTFVVTFPLDSSAAHREVAEAWEAAFLALAEGRLQQLAHKAGLRLSFSAERSVADELARESTADVSTVAWSYAAMLLYVAVALSSLPRGARRAALLVHSRMGLALGGVAMVAAAVTAALGLCSLFGMWATLIILEVIPFLALAVGVDNMFILAHAAGRQQATDAAGHPMPVAQRMGAALEEVGPSITLAAAAETLAFALGGLTPMPAVRNFSLCAALAIFLDFVLQVTAFVALLAIDQRRMEAGRLDLVPCLQLPALLDTLTRRPPPAADDAPTSQYQSLSDSGFGGGNDASVHNGRISNSGSSWGGELGLGPALQSFMANTLAPKLRRRGVQGLVLALFATSFFASLAMLPRVSRGLEQQVALPRDSYLQDYFGDVTSVMRVGPPLFFVVKDLNMSRHAPDVNRVCSISGCDDTSLLNQIERASQQPGESHIASPAASWLDDFLSWLSPEIPQCCRVHPNKAQCPPPDQEPCRSHPDQCADCDPCFQPPPPDEEASNLLATFLHHGRPSAKQVAQRLPWFLEAAPSEACAKGGAGAYNDAIQADPADDTGIAGLGGGVITASAFRTAYVPLSSQSDFIDGLQAVRDLAARLSKQLGLDVYSFSVFHVFFEQYLDIGSTSVNVLGSALIAVFVVGWLLLGSVWGSAMVAAVICALLVQLAGILPLLGVQLNAVSLVNLTMAAGISVEFCAHLVHAFLNARGSRPARASAALSNVGASVLSGITLTKLVGVAVLAHAQTQIFEVYYFRMYMALVVYAAAHGLVLLPVLLALAGPPPAAAPVQRYPSEEFHLQERLVDDSPR